MSNNEEMNTITFDSEYPKKPKASMRISALPHHIRDAAMKLDVDCDGALDNEEIANAIHDLDNKKKTNSNLKKIIAGFVVMSTLLIACIFGASVTAARLSNDLVINHDNGFAYVKGTEDVMKTSEATQTMEGLSVGKMSDKQLQNLREILLEDGSLRFVVKGHARDPLNDYVLLLVEGGSLSFDEEGIVDARGDAKYILETVYGPRSVVHGTQRSLYVTCGFNFKATFCYPFW